MHNASREDPATLSLQSMAFSFQRLPPHGLPPFAYTDCYSSSFSKITSVGAWPSFHLQGVTSSKCAVSALEQPSSGYPILFLSNGHGEDSIAVAIMKELQSLAGKEVKIEALPIVGLGQAYDGAGIYTIGPSKIMPSGGFIYMNIWQLFRDMLAGLLSLSLEQWMSVAHWVDENPNGAIVAVGDIVPLALAWMASRRSRNKQRHSSLTKTIQYSFIGTAKSEYYRHEDDGSHHKLPFTAQVESALFPASVYFPWERALMADNHCRLVAVRDNLTAEFLKQQLSSSDKVKYLGNPMMDNLEPSEALDFLKYYLPARFIALLPGSRAPEVHSNWSLLLKAVDIVSAVFLDKLIFLAPIVPFLDPYPFIQALLSSGWQPLALDKETLIVDNDGWPVCEGLPVLIYRRAHALIVLLKGCLADVGHWAEAAIAMAGTGTEQLVGLGKPVFTLAGAGPQFTNKFAEAQSRLLGKSVVFCSDFSSLAASFPRILSDKAYLHEVSKNGERRMGKSGGAQQIAQEIWTSVSCQC